MSDDMFNMAVPVVDRDLRAMTMGFSPMPYMGLGYTPLTLSDSYIMGGSNLLNGTKLQSQPAKDAFVSKKSSEKKNDSKLIYMALGLVTGALCAKPIAKCGKFLLNPLKKCFAKIGTLFHRKTVTP